MCTMTKAVCKRRPDVVCQIPDLFLCEYKDQLKKSYSKYHLIQAASSKQVHRRRYESRRSSKPKLHYSLTHSLLRLTS